MNKSEIASPFSPMLPVLDSAELTIVDKTAPQSIPSNANAKAVRVINNNKDGKEVAVGKQGCVDALSTPQKGDVLGAKDSVLVYVTNNSNEVYVAATVDGTKVTYKILG